jgi:hypothetical protein
VVLDECAESLGVPVFVEEYAKCHGLSVQGTTPSNDPHRVSRSPLVVIGMAQHRLVELSLPQEPHRLSLVEKSQLVAKVSVDVTNQVFVAGSKFIDSPSNRVVVSKEHRDLKKKFEGGAASEGKRAVAKPERRERLAVSASAEHVLLELLHRASASQGSVTPRADRYVQVKYFNKDEGLVLTKGSPYQAHLGINVECLPTSSGVSFPSARALASAKESIAEDWV